MSARSNLELIAFVRAYLEGYGIASTQIPSEDGKNASLFASIGPAGKGGIGLSSHSDCVPVDGQTWSSDPFELELRDGKLYGRGSCDMKGFFACVLASVPLFLSRTLNEPIHIIVSYDEEVDCTGIRPLIAQLGSGLPQPRAIIVGEPTTMAVIDAHKRIDAYRTVVRGREAHSSLPRLGVNAISFAVELIEEIDRIGAALASRETNDRFDPPFSTVQVGTIEGGTATNIVPKTCKFHWQGRSLPEADPDYAPKRLEAFAEGGADRVDRNAASGQRAGLPRQVGLGGRRIGAGADRRQCHEHGVVRDRSRTVRGSRLPDRDLRSWRYRAGACRG